MDSGVDSSLHSKCHHLIIYSKLNLKIEYYPPYIGKIWNYKRAETDLIDRAIENCDWPSLIDRAIENCDWLSLFLGKNVHQQVEIFHKTLLNIFHNYIPNKFISCDEKEPPWINEKIKSLIYRKNPLYQRQRKSGSIDYLSLEALTLDISNAISSSKLKYHERLVNKLIALACGKVFEKIIFNSLFVHLNNNNLLNSNQSGFRPGDSCLHHFNNS